MNHASDCAQHNAPASPAGPCDCRPADFGAALQHLKEGRRITRTGWNGKGMFLMLIQGSNKIASVHGFGFGELQGEPVFRDAIFMLTANNELVPWTAAQSDILANDWSLA